MFRKNVFKKCAECNKIFAMKLNEEKLVGKEKINILETLTQPHLKGGIDTVVKGFVPGERRTYESVYICRFCGAKQTKFSYKNFRT